MVKIIDNRSAVSGVFQQAVPDPDLPGYHVMEFDLHKAAPYGSYPQLVSEQPGDRIHIKIPSGQMQQQDFQSGRQYDLLVRAAKPGVYFYSGQPVGG